MITPDGHTGAGGNLMTPKERATPQVYDSMTEYEKVLWTFLAGQPIKTAESDWYIQGVTPGPISMGERKLTRSDMRTDDQHHFGRLLQAQSESFGLARTLNSFAGGTGPDGRLTTSRSLVRDRSELRTIGSDTVDQRAARLCYTGDEADLWEYIHERCNGESDNLRDTTFFQTRKDLTNDDHLRHVVPAQWHLETWPHATHDVEDPASKLTKDREQMWAVILEFVCEIGGRVFMEKEDALSFFAWQDRGKSGRATPWLARLDALLSTFGVHSRLTGSTLYSRMVFMPETPPLLGEPTLDYRAWWVPEETKKPWAGWRGRKLWSR